MSCERSPLVINRLSTASPMTQQIHDVVIAGNKPPLPKTLLIAQRIFGICGIAISFVCLYPSAKLAFQDSAISAYAVVADFGPFGAWGYWKLGELIFTPSAEKRSCSQTVILVVHAVSAMILGFASRLPSAGVALVLSPNLSLSSRIKWGITSLLGSAGPECLSSFLSLKTVATRIATAFSDQDIKDFYLVRETLVACIEGALEHGLPLDTDTREQFYAALYSSSETSSHPRNPIEVVKSLYTSTITSENHERANKEVSWPRKISYGAIGVATVASSTALLVLNAYLSEGAINYFIPHTLQDWLIASGTALTFAYTATVVTTRTGWRLWDKVTGLFSCKNEPTYAETYYRKTAFILDLWALFQASLIWGLSKEETENDDGAPNAAYTKIYEEAVFTALFLLVYNALKELFIDPAIELYASKYGTQEEKHALAFWQKMQLLKRTVIDARLPALAASLHEMQLQSNQLDLLNAKTSYINVSQLSSLLQRLHKKSRKENV